MGEIVSLKLHRKRKQRAAKEDQAAENRAARRVAQGHLESSVRISGSDPRQLSVGVWQIVSRC